MGPRASPAQNWGAIPGWYECEWVRSEDLRAELVLLLNATCIGWASQGNAGELPQVVVKRESWWPDQCNYHPDTETGLLVNSPQHSAHLCPTTQDKNWMSYRNPSESHISVIAGDGSQTSNKHLHEKDEWTKGKVCVSVGHTTASTTKFLFTLVWLVWFGFCFFFEILFLFEREVAMKEGRCVGRGR